ncbi:hypothetical protein TIFTF001_032519 [Ficus carica]|uniref:Uncharacterized protein n=1 Tax=Ficus carica TaxID=3494 RepID=A0AA88J5X0_FICCA|nr:hypothetical protein TIFTF001_032519 [Ficus carica]
MAESAVLAILRPVIDKLGQLLFGEANLFKHVHIEVKSLTDELETIQCFLKEAGENAEMRDGVKTWVKQVREEAYRIEDVMDAYLLHVAQHHHQRRGLIGFLHKIGHSIKAMRPRYDIASEIQNIKASLSEIKDRGERYGFNSLEQRSLGKATNVERKVDPRLGSHFIEESELVGIGSLQDELSRWLIQGTSWRSVITLVGTGGICKTTLARKLYDNEVVRGNFNCGAWMNVSQSYNMEQLLSIMNKQIFPANESTSEESSTTEELIRTLRKYLKTKRYVVIFDDVWQVEFWEFIKHVVPSNNQGSRVIVMTRSDAIAASCKETSCDLIHKLLPWSLENSLELFCKKAFQSEFDGRCPQELEELSFKIVEKCKGLPLVIAAVAGLLSTKTKDVSE